MKTSLKYFIIILLITFSACSKTDSRLTEANDQMIKIQKDGKTPGIAVTVSIDNKVIWSKGFGLGNIEQQTPVYPEKTRFRIGSISKPLTAAALGVLISENKIDVDLPVQNYVPLFPEKRWTITTRQTAGHLAGIRHYRGNEFLSSKFFSSVREGLSIFENDTLLHKPNTKFSYSSYGYNLLSAIIEGASGTEFLTYMDNTIFKPLKMNNTIPDLKDSLILFRSGFYGLDSGKTINAPYVDNSYKWAGGGYLSTSEDIVRFGNAILNNELFTNNILDSLIVTQITTNGDTTNYGMGFGSGINDFGRYYFGHSGGSVGGSCNLLIFPKENLVIAALANNSGSKVGNDLHNVVETFLKKSE